MSAKKTSPQGKSPIKKIFATLALVLGVLVLAFGGFLAWATLNDFQPDEKIPLKIQGKADGTGKGVSELTILNWNIGYAGLGAEQDFFLDGGTKVRASQEDTERYLQGIADTVQRYDADIVLLQEIDREARRSYGIDQAETIAQKLPDHSWAYAPNFLVPFVPMPLHNPMGKVDAGLVTYSRVPFWEATRVALPGSYSWPTRIFHLDRCALVSRHPADGGKEWVIIHTHNSAYDASGQLRRQQLIFLGDMMKAEYEKGNYVILSGDWNSILPGSNPADFTYTEEAPGYYLPLPDDFTPPGWQWHFDPLVPTNRSLASAYQKGKNFVTIIDGFLTSPNIEAVSIETVDTGFALSDHNPLRIRLKVREN